MYTKKVFLQFPWSHMSFSGVTLAPIHITSAYDIIVRAMLSKMKYEKLKILKQQKKYEDYNLSNPKTFNSFVNNIKANISDKTAVEFLLNCLVAIRDADFSNKKVRDSFDSLKEYLCTETVNSQIIKKALVDAKSFINFPDIINHASKEVINEDSAIITKIKSLISVYKDSTNETAKPISKIKNLIPASYKDSNDDKTK